MGLGQNKGLLAEVLRGKGSERTYHFPSHFSHMRPMAVEGERG